MVYKRIVIGATYAGCAAALDCPGEVLVIERNGLIGAEFSDALNERGTEITVKTETGKKFYRELLRRQLVTEKDIYLGASVYVLADMLKKSACKIVFLSAVTEIKKMLDGLLEIDVFGQNGFESFYANEVIVTDMSYSTPFSFKRSLCALVDGEIPDKTYTNSVNELITYKMPMTVGETWDGARERICSEVNSFGRKVIHIANTFAFQTENIDFTDSIGVRFCPSVGFENAVNAFDGGAAL